MREISDISLRIAVLLRRRYRNALIRGWRSRKVRLVSRAVSNRRETNKPTPVYFLVSQPELWWSSSLVKLLKDGPDFRPVIVVFPDRESHRDLTASEEMNYNFARTQGVEVIRPCLGGHQAKVRDVIEFGSIAFLQQPEMHLPQKWRMSVLGSKALLAYVPYGLKVSNVGDDHFNLPLHNAAWRIFAETTWHATNFTIHSHSRGKNVRSLGYPKFDGYGDDEQTGVVDQKVNRYPQRTVIIAPHWSVRDSYLGYSTFEKFHSFWCRLATDFPQICWIMKPHPRLEQQVVRTGVMTSHDIEKYFEWWEKTRNTRLLLGPDYLKCFKQSAGMLTDSGSFIAEYLPTRAPLLLMESGNSVGYNEFGSMILETQYRATTEDEIYRFVEETVIRGDDPARSHRDELVTNFGWNNPTGASAAIYSHLRKEAGKHV